MTFQTHCTYHDGNAIEYVTVTQSHRITVPSLMIIVHARTGLSFCYDATSAKTTVYEAYCC